MKLLLDFILFRKMILPYILQVLFWAGIAGTLYGSYWLYTHNNWAWIMAIVFGPLLTRVIFELVMLRFETYQRILTIEEKLQEISCDSSV